MNMTSKMRYAAPAVVGVASVGMGLASAITFANTAVTIASNPSSATLGDWTLICCAILGAVLFATVAWGCVCAIITGRSI